MIGHEPRYLVWFDDDKRKTDAQKALDGIAAYFARFGTRPLVVVCHVAIELPELTVQVRAHVQPNNYWLGMEVLR
jgi:hypothetical protein